jgi:AAA domain
MSLINPRFGRPGHDRRYASGEIIHEIGDEMPVHAEAPPVAPPIDAAVKGITMRRVKSGSNGQADDGRPSGERKADDEAPFIPAHPGVMAARPGELSKALPPPPDRNSLLLSEWCNREIPPRDHLLGSVMCTTSRWFIFGETGVGKTLIGMDLGAAIAAAVAFLKWTGQRKARVMYIDGELPKETFKERMILIATRYGSDLQFYGYNREDLGDDGLPPLNTEAGQAWLRREIEAIKPDLIIFDSLMCLLVGSMSEEATWMPMRPFVRELTQRHIAQVWIHHANDSGKSFGDKTREWEMDTIVFLSRMIGEDGQKDDTAIKLEFRKSRLRTPANADQFEPLIIRPGEVWECETAPKEGIGKAKGTAGVELVRSEFLKAYDRLADGITKSVGLDGKHVLKVAVDAVRDELKSRGFLQLDEKGNITPKACTMLWTAKAELLKTKLVEDKKLIWRP